MANKTTRRQQQVIQIAKGTLLWGQGTAQRARTTCELTKTAEPYGRMSDPTTGLEQRRWLVTLNGQGWFVYEDGVQVVTKG